MGVNPAWLIGGDNFTPFSSQGHWELPTPSPIPSPFKSQPLTTLMPTLEFNDQRMAFIGHSFGPPNDKDAEDEEQASHHCGSSLELENWWFKSQRPGHAGGGGGGGDDGGGGNPWCPWGGMLHGFSWQQLITHEKKPSNITKDILRMGTYSRRRRNKRTIPDLLGHNQMPHPLFLLPTSTVSQHLMKC